jgi:glutathione S-transferase
MLTFYYHPLSPISRRVWVCLLEKGIEFEARLVQLNLREQFKPEFLALNPFHHVPVILDGDVRLIDSIAILDYLDAKYTMGRMTPDKPGELGRMRMIQMVVVNEVMGALPAIVAAGNLPKEHRRYEALMAAMGFLEGELSGDYFGGGEIDLADCVAGVTLLLMRRLGMDFGEYGGLVGWMNRLEEREAWRETSPGDGEFDRWRKWIGLMVARAKG